MTTVFLTNSMFTFRIRLGNDKEVDLDHHGSGLDGRYLFKLEREDTPLECFDPTRGYGNSLILKGHDQDDNGYDILHQDCPVCKRTKGRHLREPDV